MTLIDQLDIAQAHRDADVQNYATQVKAAKNLLDLIQSHVAFIEAQKDGAMTAHDKAISGIKEQIEAHKAFIGGISA